MAKRVLGNDPFQRGAAQRPAAAPAAREAARPGATPPKKAGAKKSSSKKAVTDQRAAPKVKGRAGARAEPAAAPRAEQVEREQATGPVMETPVEARASEVHAPVAEPEPGGAESAAATTERVREALPGPARGTEPRSGDAAPELLGRPALVNPKTHAVISERIRRSRPTGEAPGMPRAAAASVKRPPSPAPSGTEARPFVEPVAPGWAERALGLAHTVRGQLEAALGSERVGRFKDSISALVDAALASVGARGPAELDEFGRDPELVRRLQPLLDFLYEEYWRVSAHDARNVPEGASILVANHSGALPFDGPVLQQALLRERPEIREPRWLVEDQIFYAPFLGTLFSRLGAIRASPENALRLLDQRRPVLVFPEGVHGIGKPFGERYRLKRFGRGGFVKLAMRTGAPIVPVAIVGAEEAVPLLGKIPGGLLGVPYVPVTPLGPVPLPSKWLIRFGEPIAVEGGDPENLAEVQRLADHTRDAIQAMLHTMLRDRRTVFSG